MSAGRASRTYAVYDAAVSTQAAQLFARDGAPNNECAVGASGHEQALRAGHVREACDRAAVSQKLSNVAVLAKCLPHRDGLVCGRGRERVSVRRVLDI